MTLAGALIGRDSELAVLGELTADLISGHGGVVLIEGEPGIGKSALVRAALAGVATGPGGSCEVFWGAGDELGQALPLLPLLEGLKVREPSDNPRRQSIVALLRGELIAERGTDVSAALAEQLLALVTELSATQPIILVLDDLQWADQASIALCSRLARLARHLPLLLVGMMRPVPLRDDLLALRRALGDSARLRLAGLSRPSVAELVTALVNGKPDGELLKLADGAAGNPLYVTELVGALARSSRVIVTDAGSVRLAGGPAPSSLSAAIADRLGFVSGPVREVLRAAALLGVDFAVPDLAIVLGRPVADLVSAVAEARAAGVLAESGIGLAFRHPMIRAALYDEMPISVRAAWHRDAGRALAEAGAAPDRVARQLLSAVAGSSGSGEPLDEWILSWLVGTAELLVGQAPTVAVELLRQAVVSCPVESTQGDILAARLADALYRVGEWTEAELVANRALAHPVEPDLFVDLHWTLAQCSMRIGRGAKSLDRLDRALASPGISPKHRARLLVLAARTHSNLGEIEKAGTVAASALEVASQIDDSWAMGWALHVLTIVTAMQGQMTDALPLFDQALTVTQADPALTDLRLLLQINLAVTLGHLDRVDEAIAVARQARVLADQLGTVVRVGQARSALGSLLFETGRWTEAMAEVELLHEDVKEPGAACSDLGIAAVICLHRGDLGSARQYLEAAEPLSERLGSRVISPLALARSLDRELSGDLPAALAPLTAGFAGNPEQLDEIEDLLVDGVRLAVRTGDLTAAKSLTGHVVALAANSEIPRRQANSLFCGGLLDHDPARLLQAADRYADASRPLLRAKALEAAAVYFISADDRDQARAAFTLAAEIYGSLGAATDVGLLQARFRAHGIRRGPRSKHRQASSGWDSLTPTEMKVATLVEGGMTNPEIAAKLFLSPRTVATHVSHILKKLGVHSRTEIAREAALRAAGSK